MPSQGLDDAIKSHDYSGKNLLRVLGAFLFLLIVVVVSYLLISYFACPKTIKKTVVIDVPTLEEGQYLEFFVPAGYELNSAKWRTTSPGLGAPVIPISAIHLDSYTGCVSLASEDITELAGLNVSLELTLKNIGKTKVLSPKSNLVSVIV